MFHSDPAHKLSTNLYDLHHCCVCSEKLLTMDRGTFCNMFCFIPRIKFEKFVHLVGFIIKNRLRMLNQNTTTAMVHYGISVLFLGIINSKHFPDDISRLFFCLQ